MKKLLLTSLFFICGNVFAEGTYIPRHKEPEKQLEFENIYRKFDTIRVTSNTLPSGSTQYIQNRHGNMTVQNNSVFYVSSGTVAGEFNIGTGGSILKARDTTGEITMPLQPSFLVMGAGGTEADVTGDGTLLTVTYATEIFDQGGDIANSTFTAPVGGKYQLCGAALMAQVAATHTQKYVQIITSNRTYRELVNDALARTTFNMSLCVEADMDANDTARIMFAADDSTKTVDLNKNSNNNYFSGYLAN